jgi:hypothetical protein
LRIFNTKLADEVQRLVLSLVDCSLSDTAVLQKTFFVLGTTLQHKTNGYETPLAGDII